MSPTEFFDLSNLDEPLASLFDGVDHVWDVLKRVRTHLEALLPQQAGIHGQVDPRAILVNLDQIYIGPGSRVEATAYIAGPAYIGANCEVRHGAYVRGDLVAGEGCILGHTSEFKNVVMLPGAHAPHFNYVGDSVLGRRCNLGAGTKLSNLGINSDRQKNLTGRRPTVKIQMPDGAIVDTGLPKMGAIVGDGAQTGCNAVLNPGCLLGKNALVYANVSLGKGYWPANHLIKLRQSLEAVVIEAK